MSNFPAKMNLTLVEAYGVILEAALHGDQRHRGGIFDTPRRAAAALMEMTSGYDVDVPALFRTFESDGYDELVLERGIPFVSLCEHHMLPFTGVAHVGYIPVERIVGLSKLARLVDAYARRLQVQERLTVQVAQAVEEHLQPRGTCVVVEASHSCMACRGARAPGVVAVTSAMFGIFREDEKARAEALALIGAR